MKKKIKELREKTKGELLRLLEKKRQELVRYRMERAGLKLKNVKRACQIKREIAQILTLIREKEMS